MSRADELRWEFADDGTLNIWFEGRFLPFNVQFFGSEYAKVTEFRAVRDRVVAYLRDAARDAQPNGTVFPRPQDAASMTVFGARDARGSGGQWHAFGRAAPMPCSCADGEHDPKHWLGRMDDIIATLNALSATPSPAPDALRAVVESLREWLTSPNRYGRPRLDTMHDNECTRYYKGLHFTTDEDCDCSLRPVVESVAALGAEEGAR